MAENRFYDLLERLLKLETQAGGFTDILDQPDSFAESETAAMIAYVIYRGAKENLLDDTYLYTADQIRSALHQKVTAAGLVMNAASSPAFDRPGTSVECQAHFLLMEFFYENVRIS